MIDSEEKAVRVAITNKLRSRIKRYRDDPLSPVDGSPGCEDRIGIFLQRLVPILYNLADQIENGDL